MALQDLLLSWEQQVHARLGYFPDGFRETCRNHVLAYLGNVETELERDLTAVRSSMVMLGDKSENCTNG